jgi:hypothetical protein
MEQFKNLNELTLEENARFSDPFGKELESATDEMVKAAEDYDKETMDGSIITPSNKKPHYWIHVGELKKMYDYYNDDRFETFEEYIMWTKEMIEDQGREFFLIKDEDEKTKSR